MNNGNDPLHGVKLEQILIELEKKLGWQKMGELLNIRCFTDKPRLKSSLKFLRTTPWARNKVEILYLKTFSSENEATGQRIRGLIAQKRALSETPTAKSDAFIWPTLKEEE
ncbi:MAG: hypothetical protein ACJAT7_001132 [Psychromonas sp.]|jgi:uncharacterized protein (DUF2132 family)|uniref:VF530 family protein n=1 Tax=Psychromonas sp. TaxID=1884585 RepID=UPI0039E52998